MSCAAFHIGPSLNFHGRTQYGFSKPFQSRQALTFQKSSAFLVEPLHLSIINSKFVWDSGSRSQQSVIKCAAARNSEPSVSIDADKRSDSGENRNNCLILHSVLIVFSSTNYFPLWFAF